MQRKNVLFKNKKHAWQNCINSCVDILVNWVACFKGRCYLIQLPCCLNRKISSNKSDRLLSGLLAFGVIHKVLTLRFRNFRTFSPPVRTYTLSAYNSYPQYELRILFFKEHTTEISFVNYYQSKKHKKRYKMKKLPYKSIRKCSIIAPKRDLESSLHFFNCPRR